MREKFHYMRVCAQYPQIEILNAKNFQKRQSDLKSAWGYVPFRAGEAGLGCHSKYNLRIFRIYKLPPNWLLIVFDFWHETIYFVF